MKKSWRKKLLKRLRIVLETMGVKFNNPLPSPFETTTKVYYAPHNKTSKIKNVPITSNKKLGTGMQNK